VAHQGRRCEEAIDEIRRLDGREMSTPVPGPAPSPARLPAAPAGQRWPLTLPMLAVLTGAIMLSLMGFQLALRLPGGQGIEDLLGWTALPAVQAAVGHWCHPGHGAAMGTAHPLWGFAAAYLLVDTWLFMPLYGTLMLLAARRLGAALYLGASPLGLWLRRWQWPATVVAVWALLVLDLLENHGGLQRIGLPTALYAAFVAIAVVLGVALWLAATARHLPWRRLGGRVALLAFGVGSLLTGWVVYGDSAASACASVLRPHALSAWMHHAKPLLTATPIALLLATALVWLFGAELDGAGQPAQRTQRAALRSGAAAMVWRTRYVLVMLGLFGGLTLGLDQCRDVLLALARWPGSGDDDAGWRLGMIALTAIAIGLFVYATWLWARLVCRVRRLRDGPLPVPEAAHNPGPEQPVLDGLGGFARTWARLLSIVPLLFVYALTAYALSDATAAAAVSPEGSQQQLSEAMWMLMFFGAATVGLGVLFLVVRSRLALPQQAAYYNQCVDLFSLLRDDDAAPRRSVAEAHGQPGPLLAWLRHALRWLTPRTLPLLALGGMVLLRAFSALAPESAAAAPGALAVVALTLTWWLGVFGALALAEVGHGRPYLLVPVLASGLLSLAGLGDNHVLPLALPTGGAAALATWRWHNLLLVTALATVAGGLWWVFTLDLKRSALPRALRSWGRALASVLGLVLALVALHGVDRLALPPPQSGEPAAAHDAAMSRPTLTEAVGAWRDRLPTAGPGQEAVFLVASEGGGIRSAYWTAQVLRQLRAHHPGFDQRTFALSGVSGGAVGIAAYTACLRQLGAGADDAALGICLDAGFGRFDALTPLLAAWTFEDGLARLLPAAMSAAADPAWHHCRQPGCGHLSRALGFEREWMRAFPAMAQRLSALQPGQAQLLLNGTWVETGELASVSSLRLDERHFPGARDVQARLGRELSLIGAAHVSARFPFINPLAAVLPAAGSDPSPERASAADRPADTAVRAPLAGHLADGGYFDNSAVLALTPVWRALRPALGARPLVVVLIRNGQKRARCEVDDPHGPRPDCIVPPRQALTGPAELDHPTTRRNWGLYADVLGPAVAVLNVSGIGAHGRHAPADLGAESRATSPLAGPTTLQLIDQLEDGTLVPLGWYLSPTARRALDAQAGCVAYELRHPPTTVPAANAVPVAGPAKPPHCR